ncbi:hypothetical protein NON20_14455 [Synechocystis sp. B12]|nr:hypothetical protein NON20_14455 [Synechocystis sp. B12]
MRQADRNRLTRYFHEQCWTHAWDSQTLFSRLRAKPKQFPEYLCNLIKNSGDRHEVLAEAIHEVHQQWIEAGCPPIDKNQSQRILTPSSNLFAGLYRSKEDNEITYYLYPKQKPQQKTEGITVEYQGETEQLEIDRPGWYLPIDSPINQIALDKGIRCKILESDFLKTLQLPARDFWILIPDPDEPDSGVYASWCTPRLGQSFILLCKQKLLKDLHLLKDERLVNWSNEVNPFGEENKQWLELHNFQVISQAWRGIFIENWELKDALQPKVNLSISLSGGLRTPNQNAWLQGYTPNITIFGFMKNVELEVLKFPEQQRVKYHEKIETNKPYTLQLNECDSCLYLIRAIHNSYIAEVSLRIVEYDSLQLHKAENLVQNLQKVKLLNDHKICGGVIY